MLHLSLADSLSPFHGAGGRGVGRGVGGGGGGLSGISGAGIISFPGRGIGAAGGGRLIDS